MFKNSESSGHNAIDSLIEMECNTFVDSAFHSLISGEAE